MKQILNAVMCILSGVLVWLGSFAILNFIKENSVNLIIAMIPGALTIYVLIKTLENNKRLRQKQDNRK